MAEEIKKTQHQKGPSSLTTGLAVGVAIGAAAVALSDKKNQDKVKKMFDKARQWAEEKNRGVEEVIHEKTGEKLNKGIDLK